MPYKSQAQRKMLHHLVSQGKLSPRVVEEFDKASKGEDLPQFVAAKKMAHGGMVCPKCGYAMGGEAGSAFAHALKYHKNKGK